MSNAAFSNPYQQTRVMTASSGELRLMLIDGAIGAAGGLKAAIEKSDHEQIYLTSKKCRALIMELATGLDTKADPELCGKLESLYLAIYQDLVTAVQDRCLAGIEKVLELLAYDRQTWAMAVENAEAEKKSPRPGLDGGGCNMKC
jgi:flagellar biosynthetic protein FliS